MEKGACKLALLLIHEANLVQVTDVVHSRGSFIYMQLWALGRGADPKRIEQEGYSYVSASDVPLPDSSVAPRPLTIEGT